LHRETSAEDVEAEEGKENKAVPVGGVVKSLPVRR